MDISMLHMSMLLLTVACLTVTQGQYYDFFQGLTQVLQQYPQQTQFFTQFNDFNKPIAPNKYDNKKKTDNQEIRTKKPPTHQYDYVFATTTPKPSRKSTKHTSSQSSNNKSSIRNYNTDIIFSDYIPSFEITTKRNKITSNRQTTVKPVDNYYNTNRFTTENINNNNKNDYIIPVTENIIKNNHKNDFAVSSTESHNNLRQNNQNFNDNGVLGSRNPNVQNINLNNNRNENNFNKPTNHRNPDVTAIKNTNRETQYIENNYSTTTDRYNNGNEYNNRPTNNRNPNVSGINKPILSIDSTYKPISNNNNLGRPTNQRNPIVAGIATPIKNTENNYASTPDPFNNNNNFGKPTNHRNPSVVGINTNTGTPNRENSYSQTGFNNNGNININANNFNSGNPMVNQPGVKPTRVDINQPPITNKPVTDDRNDIISFDRPTNPGYANTERPIDEPEIIIGPDEDDMSDRQKKRYIDIAERMCDKYKSLDVKEVAALPLLPSAEPVEFNVTSCVPNTAPLVIGGKVVTINEFPHMALVGWRKIQSPGYSWKCGASLISEQYLLTAGHCTYQDKDYEADSGPPQAVQLGSSYHDDPNALVMRISAVIRHPKYKQRRSYFDLALIKMVRTVRFSDVIRPACLGLPPAVGENVIATGWGRTEFGGDHSEELRSVSLKVWNMAECREIWGTSLKLPNGPTPVSHVCAGDKRGGKDTCQGDSGGPAQIQDGCAWRVIGVTSFGRSCGAPNTPALYSVLKIPFISAQVFGDKNEDYNNGDRRRYDDRRQPVYSDRQQGFTLRPIYVVNNFKRE